MLRAIFILVGAVVVLIAGAGAQSVSERSSLPETEIRKILVDRIDVQRQGVGSVVGVITLEGQKVIAYRQLENSLHQGGRDQHAQRIEQQP